MRITESLGKGLARDLLRRVSNNPIELANKDYLVSRDNHRIYFFSKNRPLPLILTNHALIQLYCRMSTVEFGEIKPLLEILLTWIKTYKGNFKIDKRLYINGYGLICLRPTDKSFYIATFIHESQANDKQLDDSIIL